MNKYISYSNDFSEKPHFTRLPLTDVHVGDGLIGERIAATLYGNMLKLDLEHDFLEPFRLREYDDCYVALGKLMDAAVHFAMHGDPKVLQWKDELFKNVIATQDEDGYIGIMQNNKRIWEPFDLHDEAHIISALLEDWRCFGNENSRLAAERLASLIRREYHKMPVNGRLYGSITKHMMGLGLEHAALSMFEVTGNEEWLAFCLRECGLDELCWPIQKERHRPLLGHSYMYLNLALAHLRAFRYTKNTNHLRHPRIARDFMLYEGGTTVIGGCGISECWTDDQEGRGKHAETCSTAYQLRFFEALLAASQDSRYGDVMERMLYNALFAAQSPDGRQIRYYNPLQGNRVYWPKDTYCCPNNYRRIISELPGMLCYKDSDCNGLTVNIFSSFNAAVDFSGVKVQLTCKTDYPRGENVTFSVAIPDTEKADFRLRLRIPSWCDGATIQINDETLVSFQGGAFAAINRTWQNGDRLRLHLPMNVRFIKGYRRNAGLYAVMRGPVVYTLNPENCSLSSALQDSSASFRAGDINFVPSGNLKGIETADLSAVRLDANRATYDAKDGSIFILADQDGDGIECQDNLLLRLTPYPDVNGKCCYFRLSDSNAASSDELFYIPLS